MTAAPPKGTPMAGRRRAALLALVIVLAGCTQQSRVDPNSTVTVSGTFRDASGQPLQSRPVKLGSGVSNGDGTLAALTLGLACTSGICRGRVRDTKTNDSGRYEFTLKGRDTQSTFGEAESFLLTGTAPLAGSQVSGASTSARFRIQAAKLDMPVLSLVDPALRLGAASGKVAAAWTTTSPGPYALTFETASIIPVWRTATTAARVALDPRLLEDTSGRAVLSGTSTDEVVGSDLTIMWRSPGIGYASAAGPPDSRGKPCHYDVGGESCPLTDGDLGSQHPLTSVCPSTPGSSCKQPRWAVVDLGSAGVRELVVVRGCEGGCTVEAGTDGRAFQAVGPVSDDFGAIALPHAPARFIRVSLGRQGLRQISVWGSAAGVLLPLDQPTTAQLQKPFGTHDGLGDHRAVVLVACVLAALGLVGVGFAAGRRRRT